MVLLEKSILLQVHFDWFFNFQVKAYGPGLEPTGCIVEHPAEFTIDARAAGTAELKIYAQVRELL